ncbi:MAG: long-chain fatty acid--CoA ligase [Candidatus Omnitrophica bacterium]|nr:long-chain fatty acid--CoA ligase [Candidatus Omnitrophota bacterium]
MSSTPDHLVQIFADNAREAPDRSALSSFEGEALKSLDWKQVWSQVLSVAGGLKSLGLQRGMKVALWSSNRPEWVASDIGTLLLGGVTVPVYVTLASAEIRYILCDASARILVVENPELLAKLDPVLHECPELWGIVLIQGDYQITNPQARQTIVRMSDFAPQTPLSAVDAEDLLKQIRRQDTATLIYTSGTTGFPKGVVLTHGNFLANMETVLRSLPLTGEDTHLSFLPLCHVFERMCGYYLMCMARARIVYARSINTVAEDALKAKPTFLMAVPRFYEKVHAKIYEKMLRASPFRKALAAWVMRVGRQAAARRSRPDGRLSHWLRLAYAFGEHLAYAKIRNSLGGRIRFCVSGGAPLAQEQAQFFAGLGILILEGYGLTETSPVISLNRVNHYKFGTVGLPVDNIEVKISDAGEILVKGPSVMKGYYHKPEETAEAIQDGWFRTGDLGDIDADGFLKITGRIKELLVLSGGKKVATASVEKEYETAPLIERCVLYGEGHHFLTALVVPNFPELERAAVEKGAVFSDHKTLIEQPWVRDAFESQVQEVRCRLAPYEQIKYFALLDRDFSVEEGEITPTLKVRRKIICSKYAPLLEPFYAASKRA